MDIIEIAGKTRDFGKPLDWNDERDGPCGSLPIRDETFAPGVNKMVSEWRPSQIELEHLKLGAPLQLGVVGVVHPVVSLGVGAVPPREAETPAARMTKIQALMDALEAGPACNCTAPSEEQQRQDVETFRGARRLILDLLGISAKPVGEQIADALAVRARASAEEIAGEEATGKLPGMLRFTRRWLPECFPADDNGHIPFARALCESLVECAEAHLKREAEERRDAALDRAAGDARRDALRED